MGSPMIVGEGKDYVQWLQTWREETCCFVIACSPAQERGARPSYVAKRRRPTQAGGLDANIVSARRCTAARKWSGFMDGWHFGSAVTLAVALAPGPACAEKEADYALPNVPQGAAVAPANAGAAARIARPSFYAADAAKNAMRLAPEMREERGFIRMAAATGRFELQASRLALSKSGNARVRALAGALLDQHRDSQLELAHLLHSRDMAMPMLENEQVKILKRLGKSSGARFDRDYLEQVGLKS
ncbi:MAG: DUF4142 domain-containing protein, partial [Ramlibacter sp.]